MKLRKFVCKKLTLEQVRSFMEYFSVSTFFGWCFTEISHTDRFFEITVTPTPLGNQSIIPLLNQDILTHESGYIPRDEAFKFELVDLTTAEDKVMRERFPNLKWWY